MDRKITSWRRAYTNEMLNKKSIMSTSGLPTDLYDHILYSDKSDVLFRKRSRKGYCPVESFFTIVLGSPLVDSSV